jgi:hypothetical protein
MVNSKRPAGRHVAPRRPSATARLLARLRDRNQTTSRPPARTGAVADLISQHQLRDAR